MSNSQSQTLNFSSSSRLRTIMILPSVSGDLAILILRACTKEDYWNCAKYSKYPIFPNLLISRNNFFNIRLLFFCDVNNYLVLFAFSLILGLIYLKAWSVLQWELFCSVLETVLARVPLSGGDRTQPLVSPVGTILHCKEHKTRNTNTKKRW